MADVFISYVEEDGELVDEIARGLNSAGYSTWRYQKDVAAGDDYLLETRRNIEQCKAFLLMLSPMAITSDQIDKEVVRAHECHKPFVPVLAGITYDEFGERQPKWQQAVGSATAVALPASGDVDAVMDRLIEGIERRTTGGGGKDNEAWKERARRVRRPRRWVRRAVVAGVVLVAAGGAAFAYFEKLISDAKATANRQYSAGDLTGVLVSLDWLLRWRPGDVEGRLLRSRTYGRLSQYGEAAKDLDYVLERHPENSEAHYLRGVTYDNEGKLDDAVREFDRALALGYAPSGALYSKGQILNEQEKYAEAEKCFTTLIERDSNDADAYYGRGMSKAGRKDFDGALEDFNQVILRRPDWGDALAKRGLVRVELFRAFASSELARRGTDRNDAAVFEQVRMYIDSAARDIERAIESSSIDPDLRTRLQKGLTFLRFMQQGMANQRFDAREFKRLVMSMDLGNAATTQMLEKLPDEQPDGPAAGPSATILSADVQHGMRDRQGRPGFVIFATIEIRGARERLCSAKATILNKRGENVPALSEEYANAAKQLMARADFTPVRDPDHIRDLALFVPYDQLPPGEDDYTFVMAVLDGRNEISTGRYEGRFYAGNAPPRPPSGERGPGPGPANQFSVAKDVNVSVEHHVKGPDGRDCMRLTARFDIANAKGRLCKVGANFLGPDYRRVMARSKLFSDPRGQLFAFRGFTPNGDTTSESIRILVPYNELPDTKGPYRYAVAVFDGEEQISEATLGDVGEIGEERKEN